MDAYLTSAVVGTVAVAVMTHGLTVSKGREVGRIHTEGKGKSLTPTLPGDCRSFRGKKLIARLQRDRRVDVEVAGTRGSRK